jgi:hypothetical protein
MTNDLSAGVGACPLVAAHVTGIQFPCEQNFVVVTTQKKFQKYRDYSPDRGQ